MNPASQFATLTNYLDRAIARIRSEIAVGVFKPNGILQWSRNVFVDNTPEVDSEIAAEVFTPQIMRASLLIFFVGELEHGSGQWSVNILLERGLDQVPFDTTEREAMYEIFTNMMGYGIDEGQQLDCELDVLNCTCLLGLNCLA